jgi:ParB family transcriptional regulator, chromosome partitioning protein
MGNPCLALDLHCVELRFAATRLTDARAVEQLAASVERCGQIVPLIAVGDGGSGSVVLIDGYRRVAALRRLGRDRARVECWSCELAEALIGVLARTQGRALAGIEEALVLRELTQGLELSQNEVARRCGRDASWVNRRLALLSSVSDSALDAVRDGRLSTWSAVRVIAPLARANADHATRFLAALAATALSTREQGLWLEHYRKASRAARERMVEAPRLFLDALRARGGALGRASARRSGRGMRIRSARHRGDPRALEETGGGLVSRARAADPGRAAPQDGDRPAGQRDREECRG